MRHAGLRRAVIATARASQAAGLTQGTSGNVSARVADSFLVTPSGIPYADLTPGMIVETGFSGDSVGRSKPSSEWRLHADIYRTRPEAQAVVHTHSPYATALSTLRIDVPAFHYMVAAAGGSSLRCAAYATFGTQALSDAMLIALENRKACLLANHGAIAFGRDLEAALALAVEVETLCRQFAIARQVGDPVILSEAEMVRVQKAFEGYGRGSR